MGRFCFVIILLLAELSKVAGQAVAPVHTDLAVTAEITGRSYKLAKSSDNKPNLILYVRLNVRNQTNQPREITFYSCGWDASWVQKGLVDFIAWGCDKNYLNTLSIPVGQSVVFYGPVCARANGDKSTGFTFGFVDFTRADFWSRAFRKHNAKTWAKLLNSRSVYWSNELNGAIEPSTTPEVKRSAQYPGYYLEESGK